MFSLLKIVAIRFLAYDINLASQRLKVKFIEITSLHH